jgi:hypothetical protein
MRSILLSIPFDIRFRSSLGRADQSNSAMGDVAAAAAADVCLVVFRLFSKWKIAKKP